MSEHNLDVLVIGGGPGGYTAAIRASQLGLSVGLAERAELGGVCLNWGCIPTKSLLHTADVMREAMTASELGLEIDKPRFNLKKVVKRSRDVAAQLSGGISHLMRKNKVAVFDGTGKQDDNVRIVRLIGQVAEMKERFEFAAANLIREFDDERGDNGEPCDEVCASANTSNPGNRGYRGHAKRVYLSQVIGSTAYALGCE